MNPCLQIFFQHRNIINPLPPSLHCSAHTFTLICQAALASHVLYSRVVSGLLVLPLQSDPSLPFGCLLWQSQPILPVVLELFTFLIFVPYQASKELAAGFLTLSDNRRKSKSLVRKDHLLSWLLMSRKSKRLCFPELKTRPGSSSNNCYGCTFFYI